LRQDQIPNTQNSESLQYELSDIKRNHAAELESLLDSHAQRIEILRSEHETAVQDVRSALESTLANHKTFLETQESTHASTIAGLRESQNTAIKALADENEMIAEEMEKSLAESEEQRRQLKMKADQALFELSRIRDESQIQRNGDVKRISELEKVNAQLEGIKDELEIANSDLTRRISEIESRPSRKSVLPPPQGPPPNAPLPPLPPLPPSTSVPLRMQGQVDTASSSGHSFTSGQAGGIGSVADITAAVAGLPEGVEGMVKKVVEERDGAVIERDALKQQVITSKERVKESVS
jgi:hypothetical protein